MRVRVLGLCVYVCAKVLVLEGVTAIESKLAADHNVGPLTYHRLNHIHNNHDSTDLSIGMCHLSNQHYLINDHIMLIHENVLIMKIIT